MDQTLTCRIRIVLSSATAVLAILLSGCAATPSQKSLNDWHDAVVAVRDQSTITFRGVNSLVREGQIRRAGNLQQLNASKDFPPGLDPDSIAVWTGTLDALAQYGAALSSLLTPQLSSDVGTATKAFSESIANSAKSKIFADHKGLASAIGKIASKIASVAAGKKAQAIMVDTDPEIHDITNHMAGMLGDSEFGVEGTVRSQWTTTLGQLEVVFRSQKTPSDRQSVATQYANTLDQRDASIAAIHSLRRSILELANNHRHAAAGGSLDTSGMIANIREQIAFLRDLIKDLKPAKN